MSEQLPKRVEHIIDSVNRKPIDRYWQPIEVEDSLRQLVYEARNNPDSSIDACMYEVEVMNGERYPFFYMTPKDAEARRNHATLTGLHPHTNEPIATRSLPHLAYYLRDNPDAWRELGTGGLAIRDMDPTGANMNGAMLYAVGNPEPRAAMRESYRSHMQADLFYPGSIVEGEYERYRYEVAADDPTLGTKMATLALADALRPEVYAPMHNIGILGGGPMTYTTHNSAFFNRMRPRSLQRIDLEPSKTAESSYHKEYGPGVYSHTGIHIFEKEAHAGGKTLAEVGQGLSSADAVLAMLPNTLGVVDETPLFLSDRINWERDLFWDGDMLDVLKHAHAEIGNILMPIMEGQSTLRTLQQRELFASAYAPYQRWSVYITAAERRLMLDEHQDDFFATIPFFLGISLGMALRLHEDLYDEQYAPGERTLAVISAYYDGDVEIDARPVPHSTAVQSQLGALSLAVMATNEPKTINPEAHNLRVEVPSYTMPREFLYQHTA